jgi:hypothetical protein
MRDIFPPILGCESISTANSRSEFRRFQTFDGQCVWRFSPTDHDIVSVGDGRPNFKPRLFSNKTFSFNDFKGTEIIELPDYIASNSKQVFRILVNNQFPNIHFRLTNVHYRKIDATNFVNGVVFIIDSCRSGGQGLKCRSLYGALNHKLLSRPLWWFAQYRLE